ncbi:MAG: carboxynorspermidine decarboxylase [Myxococcales bacterium SG8_38_1]|nr:MAG: carboxynorspermidine decarboxylase [Myxococcales bacterium SG8_38_1]
MRACEQLDLRRVDSPAFVIDLAMLERNLELLAHAQAAAGATILLALKGFAAWSTFPLVGQYLDGVAASGPDEARLGREELGKQVHTYCPAFDEASLRETIRYSDHVIFNSPSQIDRFRSIIDEHSKDVSFGLRVNPQHSEVEVPLYDPCAPGSRLGATKDQLVKANLRGIDGLHFHTLCELGADALERTLEALEEQFAPWLDEAKWVNFGGGHHITKPNYDVGLLVDLVRNFRHDHRVDVYLEPGEAIGLNAGVLVASVLDLVENDGPIAILDTSATAHMPDVLEMPYRPEIRGAAEPGRLAHTYRLGGLSCLAGDMIGAYSFDEPLSVGDKLVFEDMAHYTMVKTTTFNGVRLPSIALFDPRDDSYRVQRSFGYEDYRNRLS